MLFTNFYAIMNFELCDKNSHIDLTYYQHETNLSLQSTIQNLVQEHISLGRAQAVVVEGRHLTVKILGKLLLLLERLGKTILF